MADAKQGQRLTCVLGMILLVVATVSTRGEAGELGHYAPAVFNVRDLVMPQPGVYGAFYSFYYTSSDLRDASGDEIRSVTIGNRNIDVDVDLDLYSLVPAVL